MPRQTDVNRATIIGAIIAVGGVLLVMYATGTLKFGESGSVIGDGGNAPVPVVNTNTCPDDGDSTLTIDVQSALNETGAETFDTVYYLRGSSGDFQTGTDTTAGSDTVNCNEEYLLEIVASNADHGDNSRIKQVLIGSGATVENGVVRFKPTTSSYSIRSSLDQHAVLEFRAKDVKNDGYFKDNTDDIATNWEADGSANFTSTSSNSTATAIGAGEDMHVAIEARATRADTNFNDYYTLVAVDAATTVWDTPTVKINGVVVADSKGSLDSHEEKLLTNYEFVYRVDTPITDGSNGITVDLYMNSLAGINPTADVQVDFYSAGRFLSIDGITTKVAAAQDDASSTVLYTVQDTNFDIS